MGRASPSTFFDGFGDQPGPAGLGAGANARAVVAVKVFVKADQVAPIGVAAEEINPAGNWTPPILAAKENMRQAAREFRGHLPQIGLLAPPGRAPGLEVLAVLVVEFLQRFDQPVIHPK